MISPEAVALSRALPKATPVEFVTTFAPVGTYSTFAPAAIAALASNLITEANDAIVSELSAPAV